MMITTTTLVLLPLLAGAYAYMPTTTTTATTRRVGAGGARVTTTMGLESAASRLRSEHLDSLSRLSSRMSKVQVETIKDVQIARVGEDAVELAVVSCEDDRCVSILVPLDLPVVCRLNDDGFDECIIQNIQTLDKETEDMERFDKAREAIPQQVATSSKFTVYGGVASEKPGWWQDPKDKDLSMACLEIKDILNGKDFESDLRNVANRLLRETRRRSAAARVDTIGPKGILLTALDDETQAPLPLALPFDAPSFDTFELRRNVLGVVEKASSN